MNLFKYKGISGSTLKIIAVVTMLIDHLGAAVLLYLLNNSATLMTDIELRAQLLVVYRVMRMIGRVAFPIFCFLLVEGFIHTRDRKKYAARLFLFALISEIPFNLAFFDKVFDPLHQNVYVTLLLGLLVMMAADYFKERPWLQGLVYAAGLAAGWLCQADYDYKGVLLIIVLYICRSNRPMQALGGAIAVSWELPAPLAFIPIYAYNGQRGISLRYFFYWFYPVHLLLLWALARFLLPLI